MRRKDKTVLEAVRIWGTKVAPNIPHVNFQMETFAHPPSLWFLRKSPRGLRVKINRYLASTNIHYKDKPHDSFSCTPHST